MSVRLNLHMGADALAPISRTCARGSCRAFGGDPDDDQTPRSLQDRCH